MTSDSLNGRNQADSKFSNEKELALNRKSVIQSNRSSDGANSAYVATLEPNRHKFSDNLDSSEEFKNLNNLDSDSALEDSSIHMQFRNKSDHQESREEIVGNEQLPTSKSSALALANYSNNIRKLDILRHHRSLNSPGNTGVTFSPIKSIKEYHIGSTPSKSALNPVSLVKSHHRTTSYSPSPLSPASRSYSRLRAIPVAESTPCSERDASFDQSANMKSSRIEDKSVTRYQSRHKENSKSNKTSDKLFSNRGLHNDPSVPYTLSLYLQLLINFFLSSIFIYFFYILITTIRNDIDKKVEEYSAEILAEMALCSKQYLDNRCAPGSRVPHLESTCISLERCMNRDPTVIGRARVSAETFSEIINSFIEPLTLRTWTVVGAFIIGSFFFSNAAFTIFRASENAHFHDGPGLQPNSDPYNQTYNFNAYNHQPFTPGAYPSAPDYRYVPTSMVKLKSGRHRTRSIYLVPSESRHKRSNRN